MSDDAGNLVPQNPARTTEPVDILLVEDNAGDVRLAKEAFAAGEIETEIHVVRDGVEALDYLYRRGTHADAARPDLVLLDLNLPRKNGDAVLAEIRNDAEFPKLPVVVLSSSDDEADVARSYELAANAYLTKPVGPDEFIETIDALESFWLARVQLPPSTGADQ